METIDGRLTSGDVCRVAGIPITTLDRWASGGLLAPANSGRGHGHHRRYTLAQCFAVAAGARYRDGGAPPGLVAGVVRLLASRPIEQTEADLAAGQTFPVPAAALGGVQLPGLLIRPPLDDPGLTPGAAALMRRLDLAAIYAEVRKRVRELTRQEGPRGRGRRRPSAIGVEEKV